MSDVKTLAAQAKTSAEQHCCVPRSYCPVFARKFKEETKEKAAEVLEQLRIVTKKPIP